MHLACGYRGYLRIVRFLDNSIVFFFSCTILNNCVLNYDRVEIGESSTKVELLYLLDRGNEDKTNKIRFLPKEIYSVPTFLK